LSPSGRFLKKVQKGDDDMWYDVSNLKEAREKIARYIHEQLQNPVGRSAPGTNNQSNSNNNSNTTTTATKTNTVTNFINSSPSKSVTMADVLNSMPPNVRAAAENNLELVAQLIASKKKKLGCNTAAADNTAGTSSRKVDEYKARARVQPNGVQQMVEDKALSTRVSKYLSPEYQTEKQAEKLTALKTTTTSDDSDESSGISSSKLESDSDESGGNLSDNTERDTGEEGSDDYMDECFICNDGGGKSHSMCMFQSPYSQNIYTK